MPLTKVFISSTKYDLEEYRQAATDVCIALGALPVAMETFSAIEHDSVVTCKRKIINSNILIGIIAYRYGYVPKGSKKSMIEIEYDYAKKRDIPRLMFIISSNTTWNVSHVDKGKDYRKLEKFKAKVLKKETVNFFRSVEDFKAKLITSLLERMMLRDTSGQPSSLNASALMIYPGFGSPDAGAEYQYDVYLSLPVKGKGSDLIQKLVKELPYSFARWGKLPKHEPGFGTSSMWSAIYNCEVFVADCTGDDHFVFYTLGIARTIGKPIILLSQKKIPSGFEHFTSIIYNLSDSKGLKDQLQKRLHNIFDNIDRIRSFSRFARKQAQNPQS